MAESKPFEPTPSWIARAKRQGNVARSGELSGLSAFFLGAVGTALVAPRFAQIDAGWIERAATDGTVHVDALAPLFGLALGVLAIACVGGVLAALLQEKPFFVFPKIKPERLNPAEGLKRMFSAEAAVSAGRALLAFILATCALVPTAREVFARGAGFASIAFFASLANAAGTRVVLCVVGVAAAFAIFDVLLVKYRWRKKLRMNAAELKRDMRESEGDPMQRSRRRSMHRSFRRGAVVAVKQAAFVVTNPTHIAIALEYRPPAVCVPRVLVRSADEEAYRVRELARECGIPVIENVPLARELFALTKPGDEIPVESYVAVATIVNELMQTGAVA